MIFICLLEMNSRRREEMSNDEWNSIQLAKKLEFEELKKLQKQENSRKIQKKLPNYQRNLRSYQKNDEINPDEMTYEV